MLFISYCIAGGRVLSSAVRSSSTQKGAVSMLAIHLRCECGHRRGGGGGTDRRDLQTHALKYKNNVLKRNEAMINDVCIICALGRGAAGACRRTSLYVHFLLL